MDIRTYLKKEAISQSAFGALIGVSQGMVWQWITGATPVSEKYCVVIEQKTDGQVTRKDLRPDDWHLIWPELVQSEAA